MNQKGFAPIILILIAVGVLALGGGVWYAKNKLKTQTPEEENYQVFTPPQTQKQTSQQTTTTQQIVKPDETADWKTYRNEEYGFEVKYPKELKYSISFGDLFIIQFYIDLNNFYEVKGNKVTGSEFIFSVAACDNRYSVKSCSDSLKHNNKEWQDQGTRNVDGIIAQKLFRSIIPGISMTENTSYLIPTKNIVITFNNSTSKFSSQDFNQILSTFKFID